MLIILTACSARSNWVAMGLFGDALDVLPQWARLVEIFAFCLRAAVETADPSQEPPRCDCCTGPSPERPIAMRMGESDFAYSRYVPVYLGKLARLAEQLELLLADR